MLEIAVYVSAFERVCMCVCARACACVRVCVCVCVCVWGGGGGGYAIIRVIRIIAYWVK